MMRTGRPLKPLNVTDEERATLQAWTRRRKTAQQLALRSRIVLRCDQGWTSRQVADHLHINPVTVSKWRERFRIRRLDGLSDEPRVGAPRTIGDEKVYQVITQTLENTPTHATHWSTRTMGKQVGLSQSAVSRIWRAFGLQPHRSQTFKLSTDPQFVKKLQDIVGLYVNPPEHAIVLSCDEKSQIQALDRTHPSLPMKPGRAGTMTHDDKRGGTTSLFAARNVLEGTIISQCQPRHRHQEWFKFPKLIESKTPADQDVHLICDNYATHKHPQVKKWASRHPRFHFHFTPTSASWLNMMERFFRDLTDKALRRGSFYDVNDLIGAIDEYINQHNANPKPFIWTASATDIPAKVKRARKALNKL
jgi:transposase